MEVSKNGIVPKKEMGVTTRPKRLKFVWNSTELRKCVRGFELEVLREKIALR